MTFLLVILSIGGFGEFWSDRNRAVWERILILILSLAIGTLAFANYKDWL